MFKITPYYNQNSTRFERMDEDKSSNLSTQIQELSKAQDSSVGSQREANKRWKKINKTSFTMKRPSKSQLFNSSVWSQVENNAYMQFLAQNMRIFALSNLQRRDIKINVLMSQAVKTRTPDQCRSHHQKMMKYHGNIPAIVAHISSFVEQKLNQEPSFTTVVDSSCFGNAQLKDIMLNEVDFEEESFCEGLMRGGEIHF